MNWGGSPFCVSFLCFVRSCDQKYIGNPPQHRKHHELVPYPPPHYHHFGCHLQHYDDNSHLQPHERHDRISVEACPVHTKNDIPCKHVLLWEKRRGMPLCIDIELGIITFCSNLVLMMTKIYERVVHPHLWRIDSSMKRIRRRRLWLIRMRCLSCCALT